MNLNRHLALIGCLSAVVVMHLGCSSQEAQSPKPEQTVDGQLQLPAGNGDRGVHVIIDIVRDGATTREWLNLDEGFRFHRSFTGALTRLEVATGVSTTVHRFNAQELALRTKEGSVDIGTLDLRERLQPHTMKFSSEGAMTLRAGMWLEKPATDFAGNLPSLGSRQFPEIEAGKVMDLLLPSEFEAAYFLVEEPADEKRGREWRSGKQKLFGPFRPSELPAELKL